MSKIKFIARQFAVSLIFLYTLISPAIAEVINAEHFTSVSTEELKERLDLISSQVEFRYTSEVHTIIDTYIHNYRKGSEVLLGRSNKYFPIYENEFKKAGLPAELKYLSVVESSLRPTAVSQVGAVGLWQFMKATGKIYGLAINSTVDERRDPMRSTQAAVAFLKDLYAEFGDWSLALAAYNCGAGGVKKAQRRSNASESDIFWDIKSYLPKETRRYVPKFVAVSYMMNYFQYHGLEPLIDASQEELATIRVYDYTTFREISKRTGLDLSTIWKLNPAFLKGYIPKSSKGYLLTLPEIKMYEYLSMTDNWGDLEYRPATPANEMHDIYLYGSMKRSALNMEILEVLPINQTIQLEIKSVDQNDNRPSLPQGPLPNEDDIVYQTSSSRFIYYKLNAQQSLMDVVDMFDITLEELIKTNDINLRHPPAPGAVIKIYNTE